MRPLRLVPDNTKIRFMRGRFAGLIVSAMLSTLSLVLFFWPGLNLRVDFGGGVVVELRGPQPLETGAIRAAFDDAPLRDLGCRSSVRPEMFWCALKATPSGRAKMRRRLVCGGGDVENQARGGGGCQVSGEAFRMGCRRSASLVGVPVCIWFRFDWQFGVGVVGTLILDITKTVGFSGVTRFQFDLTSVAALLP